MNTLVPAIAILLTSFLSFESIGQKALVNIPIDQSWAPKNVQAYNFHDSIFFSYSVPKANGQYGYNSSLILPNGNVMVLSMSFDGELFCGATSVGGSLKRFYLLRHEKKSVFLRFFDVDFQTLSQVGVMYEREIPGNYLGAYTEGANLLVYVYEKNSFLLRELTIDGKDILKSTEFSLTFDLADKVNGRVGFIPKGSFIGAGTASARTKVYVEDKEIIILKDVYNIFASDSVGTPLTSVTTINRDTGIATNKTYSEDSGNIFKTAISGDYLFRAVVSFKQFELKVYNLSDGSMKSHTVLFRKEESKSQKVYFRSNEKNIVLHNMDIFHMIKAGGDPFLQVSENEFDEHTVTFGTYYNPTGGIGSFGGGSNLMLSLMLFAATTAIRQVGDGPGESKYFYLRGKPEQTFNVTDEKSDSILRNRIDRFEIDEQDKEIRFDFKNYFQVGNSVLAVYKTKKEKSLRLVLFD